MTTAAHASTVNRANSSVGLRLEAIRLGHAGVVIAAASVAFGRLRGIFSSAISTYTKQILPAGISGALTRRAVTIARRTSVVGETRIAKGTCSTMRNLLAAEVDTATR